MILQNIIKDFKKEDKMKFIVDQINDVITSINKYSVIPVYLIQFLVNRVTHEVVVVGMALDNLQLMVEAASVTSVLEAAIHDKMPDSVSPTVIVYPAGISLKAVLFEPDERFLYSSSYIIAGKQIKGAIKDGSLVFDNLVISSSQSGSQISVDLVWKGKEPWIQMISKTSDNLNAIKLPLINYTKVSPNYVKLIENAMKGENLDIYTEEEMSFEDFMVSIKENQMYVLPQGQINLFKDFFKVKPLILTCIYDKENVNDRKEVSVCLNLGFGRKKLNHMIFYRYIEGVVDDINASSYGREM